MAQKAVKRGRGRPRKEKPTEVIVKRGRGRPRKNPLPTATTVVPKKRGRPKKNKTFGEFAAKENVEPLVPMRVGKNVGCCPTCHRGLCTLDHVSKIDPQDKRPDVYICYHCNKELKESQLLPEAPRTEPKYKSKREYLEDCLKIHDDAFVSSSQEVSVEEVAEAPPPDNFSEE
jgi:hypothetical protein